LNQEFLKAIQPAGSRTWLTGGKKSGFNRVNPDMAGSADTSQQPAGIGDIISAKP